MALRSPSATKNPLPTFNNVVNSLDNYKVLRKLGEGGFGSAYLVEDKRDHTEYVLKVIHCKDKDEAMEALKEMVMMRICVSPHVVTFKEYFRDTEKNEVSLVMEYCEDGDLYHRLKEAFDQKRKIPEQRILRWFTQICMGLRDIHGYQMMHRDVKPGNCFLSRWDVVKLGDFGLGALAPRKPTEFIETDIAGTPGFMSPELESVLCRNFFFFFRFYICISRFDCFRRESLTIQSRTSGHWAVHCMRCSLCVRHISTRKMDIFLNPCRKNILRTWIVS